MGNQYFESPRSKLGPSETTNRYKRNGRPAICVYFMKRRRSHSVSLPGVVAGVMTEVVRRLVAGGQTGNKQIRNLALMLTFHWFQFINYISSSKYAS